ncbi:MAG: hypothetical protein ACK50P_19240 [Planctomycetaceae bacterium]
MRAVGNWRVLLMVLGMLVGCQQSPQSDSGAKGTGGGAETASVPKETSPAPGNSTEPAATPDAAVQQVLQGIERKELKALWDFLPGSYQRDLQSLVRQTGDRMDPEVWDRLMEVVRHSARMMKSKEKWLQTPAANEPPRTGAVAQLGPVDYAQLAGLLNLLADSELGRAETLKSIDLGAWTGKVGRPLLEQVSVFARRMPADPLARTLTGLQDLKFRSRDVKGDSAVVEIVVPNEPVVEVPYVKVDGKWIPVDLANGWIEGMGQAQARLAVALAPDNLAALKPQLMTGLNVLDEWLKRLEESPNKESFDFAWAQGLQNVMTVASALQPDLPRDDMAGDVDPSAETAVPVVKVVVQGELTFDQQDEILEKLAELADDGTGSFREISATKRDVTVLLGPVADVEAFARKMDLLDVSKVDPAGRMILATPK